MHTRIGLFCGTALVTLFAMGASVPVSAQVVHLPSTQVFSYSGSVLAPDRGSTSLGGTGSSRTYSSQFGRPRSRSLGSSATAGNTSVNAHIIDLDEIDRQIRGLPPTNTTNVVGNRVPPRTNRRTTTIGSKPVAGIHTRPHEGEVINPKTVQRRKTFNDFTPGDYMMILSHPGLVKDANDSIVNKPSTGSPSAQTQTKKSSSRGLVKTNSK